MRAFVRFVVPDGSHRELVHGDVIGRLPRAALALNEPTLSEAHAMVSLRGSLLKLLALRGRVTVRGRSLADQLLALARAQGSDAAASAPAAPCSVQVIYRRVLEDLMPLADARRIDIGVEGAQDAAVRVQEPELIALVEFSRSQYGAARTVRPWATAEPSRGGRKSVARAPNQALADFS